MLRPEWAVMGTWKAATLKKMQMMEAQLVSKRSKDYQSQLCDIFGLRICGSEAGQWSLQAQAASVKGCGKHGNHMRKIAGIMGIM